MVAKIRQETSTAPAAMQKILTLVIVVVSVRLGKFSENVFASDVRVLTLGNLKWPDDGRDGRRSKRTVMNAASQN